MKGMFRKLLTSAAESLRIENWEMDGRDLDPACPVPWSIRKRVLHGGRQEGVDIIEVDGGKLRLTVVPTRGMGILKVEAGGVRLGWDSPIREVVHPSTIDLGARGGLGFLEGFNEWLARCGLEWAGEPGKDEFVNNVGDMAEMDLTVHGRIANLPASEVEVIVEPGAGGEPPRIRVRGRVDERTFFGPKLELWAEVSTVAGSGSLLIEDAVTNRGARDQEFQVIYHTNYGPPLLEEGARFVAPVRRVTPFNASAAAGVDRWTEYGPPERGFIERVYCVVPHGDERNRTRILLRNAAGDRAATMDFSLDELPCVALWKNTAALEDGYVTGLEPSTGFPSHRRVERKMGRVPRLAPGETRRFAIAVGVHAGKGEVDRAIAEVDRIAAGRPAQVDREPETHS
jgi:hypothetical protein